MKTMLLACLLMLPATGFGIAYTLDNGVVIDTNTGRVIGGIPNDNDQPRSTRQGYQESYIGRDGYRYTDPSQAGDNCQLVDTPNGWQCRSGR